jgi:hypothetical protein
VFGPKDAGAMNVVRCEGQRIKLPGGKYNHLYLLAASTGGPAVAAFKLDKKEFTVELQDYADPLGQWNNRVCDGELVEEPDRIAPAYINRLPVAWYGSHRHTPECENDTYRFTYLFLVDLVIPSKAKYLTLPDDERVKVMAGTLVKMANEPLVPAQPLYDETHNTVVKIATDSSAFAGQATVSLNSPIPATDIFYTLDGTVPTTTSLRYSGPFTVTGTTTISARAFKTGYNGGYTATRKVVKLELREPYPVGNLAGGLEGRYYQGEWERLPDFDSLETVDTFVADNIVIPEATREEDYGLTFTGYVKVPADGVYAFSINSDDGSRLFVADTMLVDNDGLHGDYEMTGLIGLKAGYYPFTVLMFQGKGGKALGVSIAGPSLKKQKIPLDMLFHAEK